VGWNRCEAALTLRIPPARHMMNKRHMSIQENKQVSL
jgi:hypothetical protein